MTMDARLSTLAVSARMSLCFVGGVFVSAGVGRASGYFRKFVEATGAGLPGARITAINGGNYHDLAAQLDSLDGVTHLFWFADIPNELPKLLPVIKRRLPDILLIQSKNNREGNYAHAALFERMRLSRSELLVEFSQRPGQDALLAALLAGQTEVLLTATASVAEVGAAVAARLLALASLRPPLTKRAQLTFDAGSHAQRDFSFETEIPLGAHPGAFGTRRRHHTHEGVDLYALAGDEVFAMEAGEVVYRGAFTGAAAGSPWWRETECVMVQGASGAVNYGELSVRGDLAPGQRVVAGELLGRVEAVLTRDKGRPMAMLHLERYASGTLRPVAEWRRDHPCPPSLCNPTDLVIQAFRHR